MRQHLRSRFVPRALALAVGAGGLGSVASAQWTVISLHPAGATDSEARAISGAQQVGVSSNASNALLWTGSAGSAVALNPSVGAGAAGTAAATGVQGGTVSVTSPAQGVGFFSRASLWNGSRQSWVDLHPADPLVLHTVLAGMDSASQVGSYAVDSGGTFSGGRACMWSGTAGSFVDLNPVGIGSSEARGVFGNQQVGATFDTGLGLACMWTGSAASFVNLNPDAAIASAATCTDGAHQYGVIGILDPIPGLFPVRWSGTADSWVNLGIPDPETHWGEVHATFGGIQVGYVTDNDGISNERACLWTGEPGTYSDLNQYLPAQYSGSNALGIWRHAASGTTYIVGYGVNAATTQREAIMWVSGPGVNLMTSVAPPADCTASPGQQLTYTVRVLNAGADASGPVSLTVNLPPAATATFANAVPSPTTITPTQLTFDLASLAATGGFMDVSITLNAVGAGATSTVLVTASAAGEADPTNNTASGSARVQPAPPPSAAAKAILSTNSSLSNSLIPGGAGRYTTLNHPFASPSGGWWVLEAATNQATAQNAILVRAATGGVPAAVARKGVTSFPHGLLENLGIGAEVNDSGLVAFAGDDNGATAGDAFVATTDGSTITEIAREGQAIPGMSGVNYGSGVGGSVNVLASGGAGFSTTSSPAGSNAYLSASGGAVVARVGITTPAGGSAPVSAILQNSTGVWGLALDASGAHSLYQADLNTGDPSTNQVLVADGTVVLQEGTTVLPGFATAVDGSNKFITMGGGGLWLARGSNLNAEEDWVIRGSGTAIQQAYRVGDPIATGSSETWAEDGSVTSTFFAQAADGQGNYVIGGFTNAADVFANSVLVYNNQTVVARENDPVDLDGNGVFDDGVYIRSFNADSVAIVQGALLVVVNLRDEDAALCRTNDTDRGQALVSIPLPAACYANCDASTTAPVLNVLDFSCFLNRFAAGDAYANCDGSTVAPVLNVLDFGCFLNRFAGGCP